VDESSDLQVHSEADLDSFMRDVSGFHFDVPGPLSGSVGSGVDSRPGSGPAIAIGPVLWAARSPSLARNGHDHIEGGGKTIISCATGKFTRVLLSPLRVI
jgi:hypothetical protein